MFRAPALELPVEELRQVLEVNVVGAFVVSRAAARRIVAQGDGGRIVHIASMMSFHAGINTLAYAASKGGHRAADEGAGERVGAARASA